MAVNLKKKSARKDEFDGVGYGARWFYVGIFAVVALVVLVNVQRFVPGDEDSSLWLHLSVAGALLMLYLAYFLFARFRTFLLSLGLCLMQFVTWCVMLQILSSDSVGELMVGGFSLVMEDVFPSWLVLLWFFAVVGLGFFALQLLRAVKSKDNFVTQAFIVFVALLTAVLYEQAGGFSLVLALPVLGILSGISVDAFRQYVFEKSRNRPESVKILGVRVDNYTQDTALLKMDSLLRDKSRKGLSLVVTPYSEFFVKAQSEPDFKRILNSAEISIPDGIFTLWASSFMSMPVSKYWTVRFFQSLWQFAFSGASVVLFPQFARSVLASRVSGSEIAYPLARLCAKRGYTVYMVGGFDFGQGNSGSLAAKRLKELNPKLKIAGIYPGERKQEDPEECVREINKVKPDVLMVCLTGAKRWGGSGEKFIDNYRSKLNAKLALGLGGTFDYIAGYSQQAHPAFRKFGLEWFVRPFSKQHGGLTGNLKRFYRVWSGMLKSSIMTLGYKLKHGEKQW